MIRFWIEERSKESRVELGEVATDLIWRSWNIVWESGDFEQIEYFLKCVITSTLLWNTLIESPGSLKQL